MQLKFTDVTATSLIKKNKIRINHWKVFLKISYSETLLKRLKKSVRSFLSKYTELQLNLTTENKFLQNFLSRNLTTFAEGTRFRRYFLLKSYLCRTSCSRFYILYRLWVRNSRSSCFFPIYLFVYFLQQHIW